MLSSGSRISSVVHQLSCFGVGFTVLDYWGLISLPCPFLWGKVSDPSASPLLSACCGGLLIIFQFCSVIWLWMLLTGSWDVLCGLLPALFQAATYHPTTVGPSAFPAFVYWKFTWRSAPCSSPLLPCAFSNSIPLLCLRFQFLVYSSVFCLFVFWFFFFFFLLGSGGQSVQEAMLVYPRCGWENSVMLGAHLLVCWMSPKQVWSRCLAAGVLLFSQCDMAWRIFPWARGSGCWSFDSPWCFISTKYSSSVSARFWSHGAHAVCFCALIAILDLPRLYLYNSLMLLLRTWIESSY
jgi:hypothetical protein